MNKQNKKEEFNCVPPFALERNEHGLLTRVNYEFDESGFINYRKLIPDEFLVPNRQFFQKRNQEVPKTIEGLEDNQILVLLAGWKWLAKIRGYNRIDHEVIETKPESIVIKTSICWIPNYETGDVPICFSALANASVANTADFGQVYLPEVAENRGLSRATRGFLNISLIGVDELGGSFDKAEVEKVEFKPTKPHGVLQKKLEDRKKSFEKFKAEWIKLGHEEAEEWTGIQDIPIQDVWTILDMMKKKEAK